MSLFTRSLRRSFAGLSLSSSPAAAAAAAPSSSTILSSATPSSSTTLLASSSRWSAPYVSSRTFSSTPSALSGNLAPRRTKHRKSHKGRVGVAIGGSLKGSTVQQGSFGLRLLEPARLTAKQLQSAETALKRKLKPVKGAQVFLRLFPDVPVCVKGNETRMGKGKGSFSYWAVRGRVGKVVFEVGGDVDMTEEVAKEGESRVPRTHKPMRNPFLTPHHPTLHPTPPPHQPSASPP